MVSTKPTFYTRLLESFPPPSFLNVPTAGIDISDCSVKVLSLKQTKIGFIPFFFEERLLPAGVITSGSIDNPEALTETLAAIRKKFNISFIRASLPEEKAYLFETSVPQTKDREQMFTNIEFKLEENVPIPPKDAIFDYDKISPQEGGVAKVSVTVFPKTTVDSYQAVFTNAGMTPLSFELEGQAAADAVIQRGDQGTHMIVDFGRTRTGLAIVKNGIVGFTTTVDLGGSGLSEVIMKHFGVDELGAQKIKNEKQFADTAEDKEVYDAVRAVFSTLQSEINRHFVFWNTRDPNMKEDGRIKKIILCGGNAMLSGLPEFLARGIGVPVERANVWANAFSFDAYVPPLEYERSLSYATAIGLALP